jgi:peptidoglycan/LPS O-acetylase OafA/YrhL
MAGPLPAFGQWVNDTWGKRPDSRMVIEHLTLIGAFDTRPLDGPVWSLVYEMRISIILPLLYIFMAGSGRWRFPASIVLLWILASLHMPFLLSMTARYSVLFVLGIWLAQHRNFLRGLFTNAGIAFAAIPTAIVALAIYTYLPEMFLGSSAIHLPISLPTGLAKILADSAVGLSSGLFITLALGCPALTSVLKHPTMLLLGNISYSLYLLHLIFLQLSLRLLYHTSHVPFFIPVYLISSFTAAIVYNRFVERPTQSLGRYWARHFAIK